MSNGVLLATPGAFGSAPPPPPSGDWEWARPVNQLPAGLFYDNTSGLITGTVYDAEWDLTGAFEVTVSTVANLRTEINNAAVRAGKTHIKMTIAVWIASTPVLLPVRTVAGGTYISCPDLSQLPTQVAGDVVGKSVNRVLLADSMFMPTISLLNGSNPFFEEVDGCTDYHFRGLYHANPSNFDNTNGWYDFSPGVQTVLANYPDKISIQQCIFHGGTGNLQRAIIGYAQRIAVFDNWAYMGAAPGTYETQFFQTSAGPGPYRIVNNALDIGGNGENMIFGGSPLVGTDATFLPQNIEVRGNLLTKPLTGWGGTGGHHKNHFEVKFGRYGLFEGNICKRHNRGGQDRSVVFKLTAQSTSGSPEVQTNNWTVRLNDISDSPGGVGVSSREDNPPGTHETSDIELMFNLIRDLNNGAPLGAGTDGHGLRIAAGVTRYRARWNTVLGATTNSLVSALTFNSVGDDIYDPDVQYNVFAGSDSAPVRCFRSLTGLSNGVPAFHAHTVNGVIGTNLCVAPNDANYVGQINVASRAALQFVDLANDNYRLAASSPGKGAGPGGRDLGCNFDLLDYVLAGVE